VAWRIGGQSRQRDGYESERGQRGQNGGDGDGGGEIAQAIHLRVSRFRVVTRRNQVCVTT
jgi:hypothetical protein